MAKNSAQRAIMKRELERLQMTLRSKLNDDTIDLNDEDTISRLLREFNFTVEFHPTKAIMTEREILDKKALGVVAVPSDHALGRDLMRRRNVALMAVLKLGR